MTRSMRRITSSLRKMVGMDDEYRAWRRVVRRERGEDGTIASSANARFGPPCPNRRHSLLLLDLLR